MKLGNKEVAHIAYLARIEVSEQELTAYAQDLSGILDLVQQMNTVDTSDIEPMAHPKDTALRLREDKITESNHREKLQSVAPQTEDGLYLVPRVIE